MPLPTRLDFQVEISTTDLYLSAALLERWFTLGSPSSDPARDRPSYADALAPSLTAKDLATVQAAFGRSLQNQTVKWKGAIAYLHITRTI